MKIMRVRRPFFLAFSVALLLQCSVYEPSLLEPRTNGLEPKDGIGWWSGPGDRNCISARMPTADERPSPQDPKDVGAIYLAIETMRIGSLNPQGVPDSNAWKDLGYDLDDTCTGSDTCEGEDSPPSCQPTVPQVSTDGNYCRDNTFGRLEYAAGLIPELAKKYGLSDDAFNCALCVGDYNFVIKISGYNGLSDDDDIRIDLYPSPGLEKILPWDCSNPDWHTHPCFTTDLKWTIEDDSVTEPRGGPDLPNSKIVDEHAYVKEGYLVGQLPPNTLFWFPGYKALVVAFPLKLSTATVSGKLARGGDGVWRITDGIIGGRALGTDLVRGFRLMGLCDADPNYSVMTDFVQKNLDIIAAGGKNPAATCDGMSVGLGYTALQAVPGKLAPVEQLTECVIHSKDAGTD
jgi:hypothetical protein